MLFANESLFSILFDTSTRNPNVLSALQKYGNRRIESAVGLRLGSSLVIRSIKAVARTLSLDKSFMMLNVCDWETVRPLMYLVFTFNVPKITYANTQPSENMSDGLFCKNFYLEYLEFFKIFSRAYGFIAFQCFWSQPTLRTQGCHWHHGGIRLREIFWKSKIGYFHYVFGTNSFYQEVLRLDISMNC